MKNELEYLKNELKFYKDIFNTDNKTAIIIISPDTTCLNVNNAYLKLFSDSIKKDDFVNSLGKDRYSLLQNDGIESLSKVSKMINLALKNTYHNFNWLYKDLQGKEFLTNIGLSKIIFKGNIALKAIVNTIIEPKELKKENKIFLKSKIKSNHNFFKSITESLDKIGDGLFLVDENFKINYMNNTMIKWFGNQTGKTCYKELANLDDPCSYCKINNVIKEKTIVEYQVTTAENKSFEIVAAPFITQGNQTLKMEVIRDVSLKKDLEKDFLLKQKMIQMGEMMENIAHQWRQPLSIISTISSSMKLQEEYKNLSSEEIHLNCDLINKNAQYLSETIDSFREFIKGNKHKKYFNLSSSLNNCLLLVKSNIDKYSIHIIKDFDSSLEINNYENIFLQALINIINNSIDVFKSNNNIIDRYIFLKIHKDKEFVYLEIKDSAGGVKEEILDRLFELYFTTKHKSIGTGLGLHMTYNIIVNNMKADIYVNNNEFIHNNKQYRGLKFLIKFKI